MKLLVPNGPGDVLLTNRSRRETPREDYFKIPDCLFQFRITPFRLVSAPVIFHHPMNTVAAGLKCQNSLICLDDIFLLCLKFRGTISDVLKEFFKQSRAPGAPRSHKCADSRARSPCFRTRLLNQFSTAPCSIARKQLPCIFFRQMAKR